MPTFVSLSKPSRLAQYAKPVWAAGIQVAVLKSKWGAQLELAADHPGIELLSGKEAGSAVETLSPTQRGVLRLGTLRPNKYQVLVVTNPALQEVATVQAPQLVEPGEGVDLDVYLLAHKALLASDVDWVARIYLVE